MKTPQEITADVYWTATDATTGPAIRALIVAGIEADRKPRVPELLGDIADIMEGWKEAGITSGAVSYAKDQVWWEQS